MKYSLNTREILNATYFVTFLVLSLKLNPRFSVPMFLVNFLFLFRFPLDSYLPALDSSNLLLFTVLSFCSSPCFVITLPLLARSSRMVKHVVTSLLTLYFFLPGVINNVSFLRAALCSYQNRGLTDNFVFCRLSFSDILNPATS